VNPLHDQRDTCAKNADQAKNGRVSGMILHAKTDEEITHESESLIGGNGIGVKTLDLPQNDAGIR